MVTRSRVELQHARRDLFEQFPKELSATSAFEYQVCLANEIRRTETERAVAKNLDQKMHLQGVRRYGDGLAMMYLSEYATRQLHRNPRKAAHLSAQGRPFEFTLESARILAQQGVPVLIVDVTNVLKIGDIVACSDSNTPIVLECKLGRAKGARSERCGRRGRQLTRMESVQSFLDTGKGAVFGDPRWRETLLVRSEKEFSHGIVNEIVLRALAHEPTTELLGRHEFLAAARPGESPADLASTLTSWNLPAGSRVAFGSSQELVENEWPDMTPPLLWGISPAAQWALMEGEATVTHGVHAEALVGLGTDQVLVHSCVDSPPASGCRPDFAWSYEVHLKDETVTVSANILRDIVYSHETVASAGRRLLEISAKASALFDEVAPQVSQ